MIENKTILITGAAGSVGQALINALSNSLSLKLILLDRNESALYFLKEKNKQNKTKIEYLIGDIQDKVKLSYIFSIHKIDTVVHCAAYKQVPMMEKNLYEVIRNNIEGLLNVINTSQEYNVTKFLFISSDKAVYPSSLMGLSKRVGEIIVEKMNNRLSNMQLMSLRFGNLIGSNGSVLPLFEEQFKVYKKIYLTTKEVKRYFINPSLLSEIIIDAINYEGKSSLLIGNYEKEIYIKELAKSFLKGKGIDDYYNYIDYIGLRDGEKDEEKLMYKFEEKINLVATSLNEIKMNIIYPKNFIDLISELIICNSPENESQSMIILEKIMKDYL